MSRPSRPSDAKKVMLFIKAPKGRPFEYRAGRVFEPANDLTQKPWHKQAFPTPLLEHAQSAESLSEFFTEEGKAHFQTEEGQKELEALVKVSQEAAKARE